MKHQREIEIFLSGIERYFKHISDNEDELNIGTPYLARNDEKMGFQYTGMITISGDSSGAVFFTASNVMLKYILLSHDEETFSEAMMQDISGEIANTIAGNARRYLGDNFLISPPRILLNSINPQLLHNSQHCYVLPIRWRNNNAQLIVNLNN